MHKKKIAIALFLMLTMTVLVFPGLNVNAQESMVTYPFIGATPNPVGVGQEVLIHLGITQQLPLTQYGYTDLTVTVTHPDGSTETLGPYKTDSTGGTGDIFVPDVAGTYKLQTHFPEQEYPATLAGRIPAGTVMLASDSEELELMVTDDQVPIYPAFPLPTEYWTRPIDAQMREWKDISGSWLEAWPYVPWDTTARVASHTDGPETGHIIWAKTLVAMGGLAGGNVGDHGFEAGDAYQGKFLPPIIVSGVLFYNQFEANGGTGVEQPVVAVDLRTGEELWNRPLIAPGEPNDRLEFGQLFYFDSYNYHGVFGYLWTIDGSTWHAFDASTGRWVYTMENVPSGQRVHGPKGEIYIYTTDQTNGLLSLWNSSRVVTGAGSWTPHGRTFDATAGIEWQVTIPLGLPSGGGGGVRGVFFEDRILLSSDERWNQVPIDSLHLAAINVKPGHEGEILFNINYAPPEHPVSAVVKVASAEEGVIIIGLKETRRFVGLSFDTGNELWVGDPMHYLEIYSATNDRRCVAQFYDGKFLGGGMGGIVYCHEATTGDLLWTYDAYDATNEILWGNNWPVYGSFVADDKLYVHTCEHSPVNPIPRGHPFICIDIETGNEVWSTNLRGHHWGGYPVIGDSTIAMYNTYDQRIYGLSKGPSQTTMSISNNVATLGSSVLVEGTIMDVSPGTKDLALGLRFPNGVPAVDDANMSAWMEYVYLQHNRPADIIGVEVTLSVLDPNNNFYNVDQTTSDDTGTFCCDFTPEVPGIYKVIATFEGSDGYYGSSATTYLKVNEAPAPTTQPTQPPADMTDTYVTGFGVSMIIAIVFIGLLIILMLRKR